MMISTVTTSTISTLTTSHITGSLAVIAIMVLLTLLVGKEIVVAVIHCSPRQFSRLLNISIAPLLFAFILSVFFNIIEVLN
jgi:hypothetical protein